MARELEYLEEALEEAEAAARWYADRSVAAALGFSEEIDAAEDAIARFPEAWPLFDHGTRRYLLRRYPFSVVYRIEPRRILIVAVAHGADARTRNESFTSAPQLKRDPLDGQGQC